jgi:large subunit ribosomal protein L25
MVIDATERKEKSHLIRENGYTPGIIYDLGIELGTGILVKFEAKPLKRLLIKQGTGAIISIRLLEEVREGVVREVQKNTLTDEILHIVIYLTPKVNL